MPSKHFQWSTLSHLVTRRTAPSPPTPSSKNNHHHNKNKCVGSTSTALERRNIFVLQMDKILLHTQSPLNTTLHSWQNGVPIVIIIIIIIFGWLRFCRKAPEMRKVFLLYANIIKQIVYWKHPQDSWWFPLQSFLSRFCANTCFCPLCFSPH